MSIFQEFTDFVGELKEIKNIGTDTVAFFADNKSEIETTLSETKTDITTTMQDVSQEIKQSVESPFEEPKS